MEVSWMEAMIDEHSKLHSMHFFENCGQLKDENGNVIDPWDPELTKSQQDKVLCRMNDVWYYLKYVVRIQMTSPKLEMSYIVKDPSAEAFIYLYSKGISAIFLGTRQLFGKTTLLELLYLHDCICHGDTDSVFMGRYGMLRDLRILLPDYILNRDHWANIYYDNEKKNRDYRKSSENLQTRCFIDELMFYNETSTLLDMVKDMGTCTYFGVSTLGPNNADLVRFTIPFKMPMYQKDIQRFASTFLQFTGYKPSFLIIANDSDISPSDKRFATTKNLRNLISANLETIRREIEIKPKWQI